MTTSMFRVSVSWGLVMENEVTAQFKAEYFRFNQLNGEKIYTWLAVAY